MGEQGLALVGHQRHQFLAQLVVVLLVPPEPLRLDVRRKQLGERVLCAGAQKVK
jgi:hypothetical protein